MGQKAMGQLTETPSHAWPRVRPKPYLLLAYKRRGRGTIWRRKNIAKKLCPFAESICPNPLSFPQA
jgi:hypothetical protein